MNILGIDTATDNCSVGLVCDGAVINRKSRSGRSMASEHLISLIDETIVDFIPFGEIEAVAVSIGPGSYTGLRIGLSTAKGLALPGQLPVLPVPTMAVLESVARQKLDLDFMLYIKSHRDLIYHVLSVNGKPLDIKQHPLDYVPLSEVLDKYENVSTFVGPSAIEFPPDKKVYRIFPEGAHVALLAHRYYRELLSLTGADLEPQYYSNYEAQKWTSPKTSG